MSRAEERLAEVEAENAALRARVEALVGRIVELEARLAKDSHNSSTPQQHTALARSLWTQAAAQPAQAERQEAGWAAGAHGRANA